MILIYIYMKNNKLVIFICMLFITLSFSMNVFAGSEEDPEILDVEDNAVFDHLDIISAWFYEKAEEPEFLFTALKLNEINSNRFKLHLN